MRNKYAFKVRAYAATLSDDGLREAWADAYRQAESLSAQQALTRSPHFNGLRHALAEMDAYVAEAISRGMSPQELDPEGIVNAAK